MSFSIVIPSKNAANLAPCIRAIREAGERARIIVIDDGVDWEAEHPPACGNMFAIGGQKPFIFARNVNLGIRAAGDDDVIVLNDDAKLTTERGFSLMWNEIKLENIYRQEWGIVASTCDNVGNMNQAPRPADTILPLQPLTLQPLIRMEPRMVCFVCVLIPRRTIEAVGLLDERFTGYGMDDDDYSLRVRNAGLKIGIFDGCFVDHGSLTSSYRGAAGAGGDFHPNMKRFIEKWGVDNRGMDRERSPFRALFPPA